MRKTQRVFGDIIVETTPLAKGVQVVFYWKTVDEQNRISSMMIDKVKADTIYRIILHDDLNKRGRRKAVEDDAGMKFKFKALGEE